MTGPSWLAADEVAALLGRPTAAVYQLAHKRKWRRYVYQGRTYYRPSDVEHTLRKMR